MHHRQLEYLGGVTTEWNDAAMARAGVGLSLVSGSQLSEEGQQRADRQRLRGEMAFVRRGGSKSPTLLLRAADRLAPLDAQLSREVYLEALSAEICADAIGCGRDVVAVAKAARSAPSVAGPPRAIDLLLDGLITRFTKGYAAGLPGLRRALQAFGAADDTAENLQWLWLVFRIASDLWEDEGLRSRVDDRAPFDRLAKPGEPTESANPRFLTRFAPGGEFSRNGELTESAGLVLGHSAAIYRQGLIELFAVMNGYGAASQSPIDYEHEEMALGGEARVPFMAEYSMSVLCNGLGQYETALSMGSRACGRGDLGLHGWALGELIEAASRTLRHDVATDALDRLAERTQASGTEWALGLEARSRALVSEGTTSEALYRESIERLAWTHADMQLARAHLLYGEWLRRENRRVDARQHLRQACTTFDSMGATAFADRSRRELLATGERVRKRTVEGYDELTAQEWSIARLAGSRLTNVEIATQLFISPRTVEWHLRKVFTKLEVTSRKELRLRLSRIA